MRLTILKNSCIGLILGLGINIIFLVLGKVCNVLFGHFAFLSWLYAAIHWPVFMLFRLDKENEWGIFYERPLYCFAILGAYWVVVGNIVVWMNKKIRLCMKKF